MSSVDVMGQGLSVASAPTRHRGVLLRQVRSEWRLVFRRKRNAAILVFLALIPVFIGIAVKVSTPRSGGDGPPFIFQVSGNGLFLVFTALAVALPVFLPLAVAIVGGDAVAGEASTGTLRYLLTVPAVSDFGMSRLGAAVPWSSEAPQCPQNLCSGGFAAPHDGHSETSGAP